MTGMDLIALAPWVFFGAALAVVCLRLRRSRRAAARPRPPAGQEPPDRPYGQEAACPEKNSRTRPR